MMVKSPLVVVLPGPLPLLSGGVALPVAVSVMVTVMGTAEATAGNSQAAIKNAASTPRARILAFWNLNVASFMGTPPWQD